MTKEKSQLKEFLEAVSVFQWVLSFLFMGKSYFHSPVKTECLPAHSLFTVGSHPELQLMQDILL